MQQAAAEKILKAGKNVFLTGAAGSGKTFLLQNYIQYLRAHKIPVAVTASTGIAATHLDGITIHSWSGLGIDDSVSEQRLQKMIKKKELRERIQKTQVLIIDEISMLSQKMFASVEETMRYFRSTFEPFGGIQLIVSGDFFQLPPVSKEALPFAKKTPFMSPAWKAADFEVCYLDEQHRQQEDVLLDVLREIRMGKISMETRKKINEKTQPFSSQTIPSESTTRLFTHNAPADILNQQQLDTLDNPIRTFHSKSSGLKKWVDILKQSMLAPQELQLAIGAAVMFVRNNAEKGYFNGTRGMIVDFEEGLPVVETHDGEFIYATQEGWSIMDENDNPLATVSQIPLRLAWAITVHKSQGMTLENAVMDLSRSFEPGQGYVALSRVKTWKGLFLTGANETTFQVEPLALKADVRFKELSKLSEDKIPSNPETLKQQWASFIEKCEGVDPNAPKQKEENETPSYDPSLFEKLRGFRNVLAYEQGIPPFIIFNNRILEEIATRLPKKPEDLLEISGISQRKCDLYAEDFLQLIVSYQEQKKSLAS